MSFANEQVSRVRGGGATEKGILRRARGKNSAIWPSEGTTLDDGERCQFPLETMSPHSGRPFLPGGQEKGGGAAVRMGLKRHETKYDHP